ncbi:MAG: hypothetical protein ABWY05_16725 [Noviherbaspirillum sp.]
MATDNSNKPPVENDTEERANEPTIVHETIPGDAPIVTDGSASAKEKGSTSTSDEDI